MVDKSKFQVVLRIGGAVEAEAQRITVKDGALFLCEADYEEDHDSFPRNIREVAVFAAGEWTYVNMIVE